MKLTKIQSAVLALLFVAASALWATELTAPTGQLSNVGSGGTPGVPFGFKSQTFMASGVTSFQITNNGAGVLVTNDFGVTNLTSFNRVVPGSGFLSSLTYVTNALVSPFFWQKDGLAAIHSKFTAKAPWSDVTTWCDALGNVTSNTVISIALVGELGTTTNTGTLYFAKSGDGQYYDTNSAALYSFSYGPIVGTNVWATNAQPPLSFLNGARSIRCVQIVAGTNSPAATNYVVAFSLNGNGRQ